MASDKLSDRVPAYRAYLDLATTKGGRKLSPLTKRMYLAALALFIKHVQDCALADLSPAMLLDWHSALEKSKLSYSACNQKRAALKRFLEYIEDFEESEQAAKLSRALKKLLVPGDRRAKREPYALEEIDLERMLIRAGLHPLTGFRDEAMLRFMWATGVRRAEVASLLFDDVALEERVATVVGEGD